MADEKTTAWGQIKKLDVIPPYNYLNERADVFNQNFPDAEMRCRVYRQLVDAKPNLFDMDDIFDGNTELPRAEKDTVVRLFVEVPLLDNYILQLVKVTYKVSKLYPCELLNSISRQTFQCENSEDFQEKLDAVLGSESIAERLSVLYSQVAD